LLPKGCRFESYLRSQFRINKLASLAKRGEFLAIDTIHESTTNPRQTFEQGKLEELAESIRQHGLIQPITVRPNENGFEIVAGARRFRASQLAEVFSIPARIVELTDAQATALRGRFLAATYRGRWSRL
jgi:ParB/RepB/Spo0J family partition protein